MVVDLPDEPRSSFDMAVGEVLTLSVEVALPLSDGDVIKREGLWHIELVSIGDKQVRLSYWADNRRSNHPLGAQYTVVRTPVGPWGPQKFPWEPGREN